MLSSKKNLILTQYKALTFDPLVTSQFLYSTPEEVINLKALRLELKSKKNQKLHFFYLWLLTGKIPYRRKFSSFLKKPAVPLFKKTKTKLQYLQVRIKSRKKKISFVPLTKKTFFLQPKNNYFLNLLLLVQFQFSISTAFEKVFFLRFFQTLNSEQKIKNLDCI